MPIPAPNGARAIPARNGTVPVETAIADGMAYGDTDAVLRAVASIEVMVPQAGGSAGDLPEGSL